MPEESAPDVPANNGVDKVAQKPSTRRWTLPAWLNHFNSNDLKIFFRCCVAGWVACLLIFINPSLQSIGVSTFFALLVLCIVPPAGIFFVYLLAALSLLFGMCLAWAWGILTMKAALAARPDAETQARYQLLQQTAVAQANQTGLSPALLGQALVYDGFMLDTRVTVVYYVMTCVFVYVLARLRCSNPKLILLQIFGMIVIDVFLVIGPSLAFFTPRLAWILVQPGAIGVGIGTVCSLIFFPQSTSYVVLAQMEQLIRMVEIPLDSIRKRFAEQTLDVGQLRAAKGNMINLYKAMEPGLAFLPLDFSRGRWNADDVKGLHVRIREAMLATASLLDFLVAVDAATKKAEELALNEKRSRETGRRQLIGNDDFIDALLTPEEDALLTQTKEALRETTTEVLEACSQSVKLATKCIHTVNTRRWIRQPSQQTFSDLATELQETLGKLRATRESFVTNTTEAILDTHSDLFDKDGQLQHLEGFGPHSLRGAIVFMVLEEGLLGSAVAIEALLDHLLQLTTLRTRHRIWFPSRLQYALSWLFNRYVSIPVSGTSTDDADDPDLLDEQAKEVRQRLRLIRGYEFHKRRSFLSRTVVNTYNWFTNTAGMYAIRLVVVTIVTAIPATLPHSAGFYYREKGIWGLITAQTCVILYMADFTFSLLSRFLGTMFGGVLGLVAWYIGSGSGDGNPYGMAASTAVMIIIVMWLRLFLPPAFAQASIMSGATFSLIVGFSWDEHHIQQYGLPGLGYVAFWKRVVTVLLGFVAAAVVQMFPKPPSATNHVCKTLANTVRTLSDHYALLLSHWSRTDTNNPVGAAAEQISIEVGETLLSLNELIALLKVDLSFGPFDQKVLRETQQQCQVINQALGRLLFLSSSLPKELQDRLVRITGILDDRVVGNIMSVLVIIEQTLRTGSPLPERLPVPLIRTCFMSSWIAHGRHVELTTTLLRDENYRRYCVAFSSYLKFLSAVDDLAAALKETVGERHVVHQWDESA